MTDLLVEHFPSIVDYGFTSEMEQQLDDIAEGEKQWVPVLHAFYGPFERKLADAKETMRNVKREEVLTELACPKCHEGQLAIKFGRNGEFLACNRYPDCDFTSNFHRDGDGQIVLDAASSPETSDVMCNVCGKPMVIKKSRFGPFLGCSGYPECSNTRRIGRDGKPVPLPEPTGVQCPKCNQGQLLQRRGKFGRPFFGCERYPKCDFIVNDLALATPETVKEQEAAAQANNSAATGKPAASGKAAAGGKAANGKSASKSSARASTAKKTASTTAKSSTSRASTAKKSSAPRQAATRKKAS